jgi:rSAM/selenodomain-associated transferase 2
MDRDAPAMVRQRDPEYRMAAIVSVVIPTLNVARTLGPTLDVLTSPRTGLVKEVVIADGGSDDETLSIAHAYGCRVVHASKGRGTQLRHGATVATEDWLLFLHADTRMTADWTKAVSDFVARPDAEELAAVFQFRLDDNRTRARALEFLVWLRTRWLALPYGDQALVLSRKLYDEIGGFSDIPLMEDVDIIRRIGRRRLMVLPAYAVTSADRYRREGYVRRSLRNLACLGLYFLGVPLARIVKLYG